MVDLLTVAISAGVAGLVAALVGRSRQRGPPPGAQQKPALTTPCPQCERSFSDRRDARDHLREVHNAPGSEAEIDFLLGPPVEVE